MTRAKLANGGSELERQPQLDALVHEIESGRHDADHLMADAVDLDRLADQVLTRTEGRVPQLVRQDDERRTAGARLLAMEPSAALGRHREGFEQLGIHARARRTKWPIASREIHLAGHERSDHRKGLIDFSQLEILGRRHRAPPPVAEAGGQKPELLRQRITERLQDRGVHHGEHRRVRADAEGDGQYGDGRKCGALAQGAEGVADILDEFVEPAPRPHGLHVLLRARHAAERAKRGVSRVRFGHSARDPLFGLEIEVCPDLAFDLVVSTLLHGRLRGPTDAGPLHRLEHPRHRPNQLVPSALLDAQLLPSPGRQPVHPHLAPAIGLLPLRRDAAAFLEAVQRRIERPMFHLQDVLGRALDVRGDPVAMERTEQQRPQNQQIEGPLDDLPVRHGR